MTQEAKTPVFTPQLRQSLVQRRVLVLDGVLDDDNGTVLAAQLLTLADEDPAADVALWINSPGGSVPSMLAIRDVMRIIPRRAGSSPCWREARAPRSPCYCSAIWMWSRPNVKTGDRKSVV